MTAKQAQAKRRQQLKPSFHWLKPVLALATLVGSVIGLSILLDWMKDPYQWPVQTVDVNGKFNYLQQGLWLEAGSHTVDLRFFPQSLARGAMVSLASGGILFCVIATAWFRRRS